MSDCIYQSGWKIQSNKRVIVALDRQQYKWQLFCLMEQNILKILVEQNEDQFSEIILKSDQQS